VSAADARISPTAHYTSYVWFANGMSHAALSSRLGRALYYSMAPLDALHNAFARSPGLEMTLLTRHKMIDHILEHDIVAGRIGQVLEIAAGLSPRGYRFTRRHPALVYVEADLPDMAAHKARALDGAGLRGAKHHVVAIDALADSGPASVAGVAAARLDPRRGTAIITEGLLNYFDRAAVQDMWRRFAQTLHGFPHGLYLADLAWYAGHASSLAARGFEVLVGAFARGRMHRHFDGDPASAEAALGASGFREAALRAPREMADELDLPGVERGQLIRIVEART
jgi:O-methyltransferase involved in polyketide biosynthesis